MTVWIIFIIAISIFLALDLGVFNKNPHIISSKEASKWTILWVTLSFIFSGIVYLLYAGNYIANPTELKPSQASLKYITGYLIELSLSADNIFVIAIIFSSFKIPQKYQHRVLFWGIIGAIIFRGLMIFLGVALINRFDWIIYVFGAFLIFTAMKMLFSKEEEEFDPKDSKIYKLIGKIFPVHTEIEGQKFFIRKDNINYVTPLFIALIVIEVMDVIFALDSVPAILAITSDPFLVFSSNIFAILGLRSMYFFLSNMIEKFSYIEYSLIAILTFVGVKMLLIHHFPEYFPEWLSLAFIALSITIGVVVSLQKNKEIV